MTMLKIKLNKKLLRPTFFVLGVVVVLFVAVMMSKPQILKGEFDISGLNNQVQNHEKRIGDLETKTDQAQTQTNQNSADISNLQQNTNTASAPKVPTVNTPVEKTTPPTTNTTQPPDDPNNVSWTNSRGTFVYKNMPSIMYTGKDVYTLFSYSNSNCEGFRSNVSNLIPANTKIVSGNLVPNYDYFWPKSSYYLDLTNYYNEKCGTKTSYYFSFNLSNDILNLNFPGKWDIWW